MKRQQKCWSGQMLAHGLGWEQTESVKSEARRIISVEHRAQGQGVCKNLSLCNGFSVSFHIQHWSLVLFPRPVFCLLFSISATFLQFLYHYWARLNQVNYPSFAPLCNLVLEILVLGVLYFSTLQLHRIFCSSIVWLPTSLNHGLDHSLPTEINVYVYSHLLSWNTLLISVSKIVCQKKIVFFSSLIWIPELQDDKSIIWNDFI